MDEVLKKYWNYDAFRGIQRSAIEAILRGDDVLALMATGGGKSLILQIPALVTKKPAIIISPLISLMQDQVDALKKRGINASLMGSARSDSSEYAWSSILIYMTPEYALSPRAIECMRRLDLSMIGIDEAHCISEWGHDYRPEYMRLGSLRDVFPGVPIAAVTATATPRVKSDILKSMRMLTFNLEILSTTFERFNLRFEVKKYDKSTLKDISKLVGPTIVYVLTTRQADEISESFRELKVESLAYHAKLSTEERSTSHKAFLNDEIKILVATLAYGMGIDKPNVRNVIHMGAPASLEAYYQQAGRAGRDGVPGLCRIYERPMDLTMLDFVKSKDPNKASYVHAMTTMQAYLSSQKCRAASLVNHFLEPSKVDLRLPIDGPCRGGCDSCSRIGRTCRNLEEEVAHLLESIKVCRSKFGIGKVVDLASGNIKVPSYLIDNLSKVSNFVSKYPAPWWRELFGILLAEKMIEFMTRSYGAKSFSSPTISASGSAWLTRKQPFLLASTDVMKKIEEKMTK